MNVQANTSSRHVEVQEVVDASKGRLDEEAVVSVLHCTGAWPLAVFWGYVLYKKNGDVPSMWTSGSDQSVHRDCEHLLESLEVVKKNPGRLPVQMKDGKIRKTFKELGVSLPDVLKDDLLRAAIRVWIVFSVVGDANEGSDRICIRVAKQWLHL
ncbi:hypothetical protein KTR10_02205 [Candidatus Kaiserbacteria bacterium]|nr:hypothetical protein [Candidatus Kaiserbacteria bacterium]